MNKIGCPMSPAFGDVGNQEDRLPALQKAGSTINIGCPMSPSFGDVGNQNDRLPALQKAGSTINTGCPMSPSVGDVGNQNDRLPALQKAGSTINVGCPMSPLLETWETRTTACQPFRKQVPRSTRVPHVSLCWRRGKPGRPLRQPFKKQAPRPTSGAPCLPLLETWETRKTACQALQKASSTLTSKTMKKRPDR